ncbi:hypothetical protein IFM12275_38020 [Nocardia sputorum]|uniref:hypothetical protein n=1 Tax=Nocardia sputorum TaxID=2984338 RepID=UPI0024934499|nr:hypothetical protein [Nocardia sputorum]BDT93826.1 hypothetical protein IFM12275_38020 [Nocardia sputorum]
MTGPDDSRYPMPASIVLIATPEGWRHSVLDTRDGLFCGHLTSVPADAAPDQARAAAVAMLREMAREFHGVAIEVAWDGREALSGKVIAVGSWS